VTRGQLPQRAGSLGLNGGGAGRRGTPMRPGYLNISEVIFKSESQFKSLFTLKMYI